MKIPLLLLLFSLCFSSSGQVRKQPRTYSLPKNITRTDYLPGVIIVKLKTTSASGAPAIMNDARSLFKLNATNISSADRVFKEQLLQSRDNKVSKRIENDKSGLDRIFELHVADDKLFATINELLSDENVEYAEPSFIYHSKYVPNDNFYTSGSQSYLDQVKAPQAWNLLRNASGVIIAIVDSGTDLTHEDLSANIYLNASDPVNGVDDDGDGYVDNYYGWDFVGSSGNAPAPDNDPSVKSDSTDHGVHVSGLASAVTDNKKGVSAIAFNAAKLMIVKVAADNNGEAIYKGYEGIKYAADHGAQIINCSWGGTGGSSFGQDVVNYALSKGCLIVAAAGNENHTQPDYPAGYPGVIGVSSVLSNDRKSGSSNYGTYVSISAPGNNILNTLYNNRYGSYSGTSMATPMVSSAAALVKAYNPELTMAQVGERLRVTADNIDAQNPNYAGQLGKGRLNVFRALSESPPSVRNQKTSIVDKSSGIYPPGDTLQLFFDLKNFLSPVQNLVVTLASGNEVTVLQNKQTVASLATGEVKSGVGPFVVYVKPGIGDNQEVLFKLNYSSGTYQDFETFTLVVSKDYINYQANQIATTITSNGRIGFSDGDATNGQGFIYKGHSLLYEASLMAATSGSRLSDNARSESGNHDEDFVKISKASPLAGTSAAFAATAEFNDNGSSNPLNVKVRNTHVAYGASPDDKYVIAEYEVFNQGNTDLNGFYLGLFTDWDINTGSDNVTRFDAGNNMAYTLSKVSSEPYAGVKLLSTGFASPVYYPMSYQLSGDLLADDNFTRQEKFQTLSSGIKSTGIGDNITSGLDVMHVTGYGPVGIPANQSVKFAFALIGGDNLNDLQKSAAAAQNRYNTIAPEIPVSPITSLFQNFPNPANTSTTIQFSIPQSGNVSLQLFNTSGQLVKNLIKATLDKGLHLYRLDLTGLSSGVYMYRLNFDKFDEARKLIIVN
ncbi:S8 family serine peptidase [Pedobacter sp. HMF7647]|uniref:S8 family serine peptidase n=1 Tax=Hufsiella arboris TaxID=2695275 RepID=A0A7K1Y974_9SPHI|nr:S8/S53 family peptidase [Hufsiella arboris]MXV51153.1 S8 family serine peptidase [Hufsiella arboris]